MTLLTISLVSCRSVETKLVCAQIARHQIKPVQLCDVSFKYNRCRCRCFNFNSWDALPADKCSEFNGLISAGNAVDFPIEHCEGVAGFFLEDAALNVRPNIKALDKIKNNLCQ